MITEGMTSAQFMAAINNNNAYVLGSLTVTELSTLTDINNTIDTAKSLFPTKVLTNITAGLKGSAIAGILNQNAVNSIPVNDESNFELLDPYTEVIKITADSDSEFEVNINKGFFYSTDDVIAEINAVPKLHENEDFLTRLFRWFISNSFTWQSIGLHGDTIYKNPIIQTNSIGLELCGGVSGWFSNILSLFYDRADIRAFSFDPGGVDCGMANEHTDVVDWFLGYKGYYDISSLEEQQADTKLVSEPLRKTSHNSMDYTVAASWYSAMTRNLGREDYPVLSTVYSCKLPESAEMLFPVKSTNQPKGSGTVNEVLASYVNAIITVPSGVVGIVQMPLCICRVTGAGTVKINNITYTLPTDEAALLTVLQDFLIVYNQVEVLTNTGGIVIEYLVHHRRCLLFESNQIKLRKISGDVSLSKVETALIVPTLTYNVTTDHKFTMNNYLFYNGNKSLKVPANPPTILGNNARIFTFYPISGSTRPQFILNHTDEDADSSVNIVAGSAVLDQCFASKLLPIDSEFTSSLELSFVTYDGSSCYYTLDGSTPDQTKTLYTTPFTITESKTVRWINIKEGYANSHINTRFIPKRYAEMVDQNNWYKSEWWDKFDTGYSQGEGKIVLTNCTGYLDKRDFFIVGRTYEVAVTYKDLGLNIRNPYDGVNIMVGSPYTYQFIAESVNNQGINVDLPIVPLTVLRIYAWAGVSTEIQGLSIKEIEV
jgi:hypothetical protein